MSLPSQDIVKNLLEYDPKSGEFRWLKNLKGPAKKGEIAGAIDPQTGYRRITINQARMYAHRLAWFYIYGEWPAGEIDHINRNRTDNRIENLRIADRSQNLFNCKIRVDTTSKHVGVSFYSASGKYESYISRNGKRYRGGYYDTLEDAVACRKALEAKHFPDFSRYDQEARR